ncbi:MAG TPA: histidine--tRNA ligase [Saprospiraceae bacterium]|nr:histidine--tRNA ligase [Saprospiraceae bacterium]
MKPSIPKGTRDFLPDEVYKRQYIFNTIRKVYEKFGFLPIETPAMESLQTLTGKYGEEGDKLLFKILNNGDFLKNADPEALKNQSSEALLPTIAKRGLRYDLTVPFARFVVMHQNELAFPFKRYQMQPVWRADRPQKSRYQEFWQCDADVIGSSSLLYEAEMIQMLYEVFHKLGVEVIIRMNNRKILQGITEVFGIEKYFIDLTIAIDKLEKIGQDLVLQELVQKGITEKTGQEVLNLVERSDPDTLRTKLRSSKTGMEGLRDLESIAALLSGHPAWSSVKIHVALARGLNYYTGCIFEVIANPAIYPELKIGSLSGGGRYDDLTSIFGMPGVSGVGISFGADRIYDAMLHLDLFPPYIHKGPVILFLPMDSTYVPYAFTQVTHLRDSGIPADIYPEGAKIQKQMKYANATGVPYIAIIGEKEYQSSLMTLKNMQTGQQSEVNRDQLIEILKSV